MSALPETFSAQVNWVRGHGIIVNADQARCIDVLCTIAQPYNLQLIGDGWRSATVERWDESGGGDWDAPPLLRPVAFGSNYMIVHLLGSYATYDMSELTRLVLAGHEHAVRVEISPQIYRWVQDDDIHEGEEPMTGAGACLRVALHARARESTGHVWEWHPTLEQVLARG